MALQVETFHYDLAAESWSVDQLPALDSERTLLLGFGTTKMQSHPEVFQILRKNFPNSHIVGCSTAGELFGGMVSDNLLTAAVVRFGQTQLASAGGVVRRRDQSRDLGVEVGGQLPRTGLRAVLLFCDGLMVDHRDLLAGMRNELGDVPIVGALGSDGDRFERAWVWDGTRIQSGLCAAVGLYGPSVIVETARATEWTEATRSRVITRASGNVVMEIDGKPALTVCGTPSGGLRSVLPASADTDDLAFALACDRAQGSIVLSRPLPPGASIKVFSGDADELLAGVTAAAREVESTMKAVAKSSRNSLIVAMSSVSRRYCLGDDAAKEAAVLARAVGEVPVIGLYTYGGYGPAGSQTRFYSDGLQLLVLSEDAVAETAQDSTDATRSLSPEWDTDSFTLAEAQERVLDLGAAKATIYRLDFLTFVTLEGTLNETFDAAAMAKVLAGRVVLDLASVEQVTSYGVRGWLEMMSSSESQLVELYLANLSEAIVNQMLMVRNFAGSGQIVSLGAPYICTVCSSSFEFLLNSNNSAEAIRAGEPPDVACPDCGNRAVFDDDPTTYFEFAIGDLDKPLPGDVREALAQRRLDWMSSGEESIEKRVEGERTVFRIERKVDEQLRWKRVLSGIEGVVRIDFTHAKGATPMGAKRLLDALRLASEPVTEILFDQVPLPVIEEMITSEPNPKLRVRTLSVPGRCANCGVVRQASIDPAGIRNAHRLGLQPESECRRCSGSIPIVIPDAVVAYFGGGKESGSGPVLAGAVSKLSPRMMVLLLAGLLALAAAVAIAAMLL